MIFIGEQIIESLKENIDFPGVSVKDYYAVSGLTTPLITVNELPGTPTHFFDGQPYIVRNSYQIETYGKAQPVDGKAIPAVLVAKKLMEQTDKVLNEVFGLTQVGDATFSPLPSDPTVIRGVVRYRGDIDVKTETIYRE